MPHLPALLDTLRRDLRHTLRSLRRSPLFTLAAVVTLAVGMGANTAIFSVVDALLLRPLPYPEPERLARVATTLNAAEGLEERLFHTGATWEVLRDHARTVDAAPFSDWATGVNLFAGGEAAFVTQQRVGAGFFRVLGVEPALGRGFTAAEDVPGGPRLAVLDHELWQGSFGGHPDVLGRELFLKGEPHTVVGVMPAGFRSTADADVWTPLRPATSGEGGGTNYGILARPRPGVPLAAAQQEVASLVRRAWEEQRRGERKEAAGGAERVEVSGALVGLQAAQVRGLDTHLWILWSVAGLVLLVVCANLASLMLARWGGRRREIAARLALGSGRGGVVRQVLVESAVLALAGAALGLVLGRWGLGVLMTLARDTVGLWQPVVLDGRVMAVSGALSLLAAVVFGLGPALHAAGLDVRGALVAGGPGAASGGATGWPRRLLVVGEVALGVLLVTFSLVLVRSFVELRGLDPGFEPAGVVAGSVSLDDARYASTAEVERLFESTLERLRAAPGVEAAAVGLGLPFQRPLNLTFAVPAGGAQDPTAISTRYVTPGYFRTLRVPLLRGRVLEPTDAAGAPPVAVVNRAFVERYLEGGESPLGVRMSGTAGVGGGEGEAPGLEIVGVVGDVLVRSGGVGGTVPLEPIPMVYLPVAQMHGPTLALVHTWFRPSWVVRSHQGAGTVAATLRGAVRDVDPRLPVAEVRTLAAVEMDALGLQRFLMTLVVALAAVALLLAAVGIYGLMANAVAERHRELGIRLALGATRALALRAVTVPGLALALAGVALGAVLSLTGARLAGSLVHTLAPGVRATDPWSLTAGALLLFGVAAVATLLPALRVLRLDPARTLREE